MTNTTPEKRRKRIREWKPAFLTALAEGKYPDVSKACKAVSISRQTAYAARKTDEDFSSAWDATVDESLDRLEQIVYERAEDKSDLLAMFYLKAHRPEKYRENYTVEHTGSECVTIRFVDDWRKGVSVE